MAKMCLKFFLLFLCEIRVFVCDKGLYTDNIEDGEFLDPVRDIRNRDISYNHTFSVEEHKDHLLINLKFGNETHVLVVKLVSHFFSENALLERHKRDTRSRHTLKSQSTNCHYHGIIKGRPDSRVAVSTCNGLTGMIYLENERYWIEPHYHPNKKIPPHHKHIIYKRSTMIYNRDNIKHRKTHKRLRNCGTREHPSIAQLEWEHGLGSNPHYDKKTKAKTRLQYKQRPKKPIGRKRRSVSKSNFVETLLVADHSMMEFHEDGDIETYLLTIFNMVSNLYQDPSIGNQINIVIVKIILIEEEDAHKTLDIVSKANITLRNFCDWQESINPKNDSDPHHHDVAILITRKDLCSRENMPCNTLGVAHIGGMCNPKKSCSVNQDNGINLAHTIAHELGHNFGMYHDNEKLGCNGKEGVVSLIMTPSFEADSTEVVWSNCSRTEITHFLDKGFGMCLEDKPHKNEKYQPPNLPPGAIYNADVQCRLQFGAESKHCGGADEMCHHLWCESNDLCVTRMQPAAPGTHCGKHKWCHHNKCVPIRDRPVAIDGGWGEWSAWSECTRTCGAGISTSERECDHPKPSAGGHFCLGVRKRYRICNVSPCSIYMPTFREVQCKKIKYPIFNNKWEAVFDEDQPCEIFCTAFNETIIRRSTERALDGTPCSIDSRNMCISGVCRKVGCNWIVDSDAADDDCGVCQGDGGECEVMEGIYKDPSGGMEDFAELPKGARHVTVEEHNKTNNLIYIKSSRGTEFVFNGRGPQRPTTNLTIADSPAAYIIKNDLGKVVIPGPLKEKLVLTLFNRGDIQYNPGVKYQYTIRKPQKQTVQYTWILSDWSKCSSTCGGGTQYRIPLCQRSIAGEVQNGTTFLIDETACNHLQRPVSLTRICNKQLCRSDWWKGPWQPCSITCSSKNAISLRRRSVMCIDGNQLAYPDEYCDNLSKPKEYEACKVLPLCRND